MWVTIKGDEVRVTGFPASPGARSALLNNSRHHYLVTGARHAASCRAFAGSNVRRHILRNPSSLSSPVSRHAARQEP